jgi:hypothetical protein
MPIQQQAVLLVSTVYLETSRLPISNNNNSSSSNSNHNKCIRINIRYSHEQHENIVKIK